MNYPIVSDVKIIKLHNGKLLLLIQYSWSNNKKRWNSGEYSCKIYTYESFKDMIEQCQKDSVPYNKDSHIWDLKINSFYASLYDYGVYLLNALENATDYYKLISKRYTSAKYYDGVEIIKPIYKKISLTEFEKYSENMVDKDKNLRYIPLVKYPDVNNECEIVDLISSGKNIEFYIGKSHM